MKNYDVTSLAARLAAGETMEDIAKEMTDALNEAQKANIQKAKKEENVTKATNELCVAMENYIKAVMPDIAELADEEDWAELRVEVKELGKSMEAMFNMMKPLMVQKTNKKEEFADADETVRKTEDILTRFLRENGLLH